MWGGDTKYNLTTTVVVMRDLMGGILGRLCFLLLLLGVVIHCLGDF
jgi:hypothetical protein